MFKLNSYSFLPRSINEVELPCSGIKQNLRVRGDRVGKAWISKIILDQRIANQPEIGLCLQANREDRGKLTSLSATWEIVKDASIW